MRIVAVLVKELVESLRDRRALLAAFAFALIGPLLIVQMINVTAAAGREEALEPLRLCGAGEAPDLVAHLEAAGLAFAADGRICLDLPVDYAERLTGGETAAVRVRADLTTAGPTASRLERELGAYSRLLAAKRLMSRGVAPGVALPLRVEMQSTNRVSRTAAMLGNAFILYLAFAPFIIGFAMAADLSAGERERRSLEPLLTHPVGAAQLVAGKFAALATVTLAGTALCVAASLWLVERSAMAELGLRVETGVSIALAVFLLLAPLCMLVAAIQLVLGFYSKTAKEAQQVSMLVSLLPLLLGMALMMRPGGETGPWPLVWEIRALAGPLLGSTSALAPFAAVAALELAAAALILLAGARRLASERVLG